VFVNLHRGLDRLADHFRFLVQGVWDRDAGDVERERADGTFLIKLHDLALDFAADVGELVTREFSEYKSHSDPFEISKDGLSTGAIRISPPPRNLTIDRRRQRLP
jgi:hypothetical protein